MIPSIADRIESLWRNVDTNFDRLEFRCKNCELPGILKAIWVGKEDLFLEGSCPRCGAAGRAVFDLKSRGLTKFDVVVMLESLQ